MKLKNKRNGFTLAELLIVVAIIAVLVAIAIPLFSNQLEKSREATDLATAREAYAEVMSAAITGDKPQDNTTNVGNGIKYYKKSKLGALNQGVWQGIKNTRGENWNKLTDTGCWTKYFICKQKKAGWATDMTNVSIGDISYDDERWVQDSAFGYVGNPVVMRGEILCFEESGITVVYWW